MIPEFNTTLRLSRDQYFLDVGYKNLIVLHHTAGGSAVSTFYWWQNYDLRRVATAYIVERDGTIFEIFNPSCWAFHLGLAGTGGAHDYRSIGIELASEGGLIARGSRFYAFDLVSPVTEYTGNVFDYGKKWRNSYRFFAQYTEEQMNAAVELVNYLCTDFAVPRRTPAAHTDYIPEAREYRGIIGHHHVRGDKTDLHPGFAWDTLIRRCDLDVTDFEGTSYFAQRSKKSPSNYLVSIRNNRRRISIRKAMTDRLIK
ncbi:MAG: N-acetylmuramoyl-L-alanine amidase [Calditrichaceae bacterium]